MFTEQQASPQLRSGKAARSSVQPSSQDAAKQSASTENTGQIEVTALEPTQSVFFFSTRKGRLATDVIFGGGTIHMLTHLPALGCGILNVCVFANDS